MIPYRGWINQPSLNQQFNSYHGMKGICIDGAHNDGLVTFYPTSGPLVSMLIPKSAVSKGWPEHKGKS